MKIYAILGFLLLLVGGWTIAKDKAKPESIPEAAVEVVAPVQVAASTESAEPVQVAAATESTGSLVDSLPEEQLRESMARLAPDMPITAIAESVMPGIYELVSGAQIFYLTPDGRYMLEGSIIDLENRVDISEQRRGTLQMSLIDAIPEEQMLVFNNKERNAERSITVFTDTDCGYCQKLHQEIEKITDADIKVRYLLFPRAGIDSASSRELQSVWCSDDQEFAMTIAKSGGQVPDATCENPIEQHMSVARQVGLRGTPLIYLDDGTKIPGYQPAAELIRQIEQSEPLAGK